VTAPSQLLDDCLCNAGALVARDRDPHARQLRERVVAGGPNRLG
jgi:hypothetical protein